MKPGSSTSSSLTARAAVIVAVAWLAWACGAGGGEDAATADATDVKVGTDAPPAGNDQSSAADLGDPLDSATALDTSLADTPPPTDTKGKDGGGKKDTSAADAVVLPQWGCGAGGAVFNVVLGRPTDSSIAANVLATQGTEIYCEYGTSAGSFPGKSPVSKSAKGEPVVVELSGLQADTAYHYRMYCRAPGASDFQPGPERVFHTARSLGSTFTFGVQGDSHPERLGLMFHPGLYALNMQNVAAAQPDFYIALGDDFSIEGLIEGNKLTQAGVDQVYLYQRNFFGMIGETAAVFLVNGNHEQAAGYLLSAAYSTPYAAAPILGGSARVNFFALPATNSFYSADTQEVSGIGLLRDYYAWQWGDALFVTIDPYWHSPVPVDSGVPGVTKEKDQWKISMGDEQYAWLKKTLEGSKAKYKFVFEHHTLGTGRGGAAVAHAFEWGGYDKAGSKYEFPAKRPSWAKPIHQLMNDNKVTVFFSAHDHVFAREKVDNVVYQSAPNPADDTYTAFNADAYDPASITFPGAVYDPNYGVVKPNSGFLRVTVAPDKVTIDYVRAVLPGGETAAGAKNGEVAYSYAVVP